MSRQTQFGARKNPAPHSRQHGLCLAADTNSENALPKVSPRGPEQVEINSRMKELQSPSHAAPLHAATVGSTGCEFRFLTVSQVAQLLQVPITWIYARTRQRTLNRLPGYRLGKYWRFRQEEVLTWVESQRRGSHAA